MANVFRYLIFICSAASLFAQTLPGDVAKPVNIRFSAVLAGGGEPVWLAFRSNGETARFKMESGVRTDLLSYRGPSEIRFFDPDSPELAPRILAAASIPAGMSRALFFFVPVSGGAGGARYRVAVVSGAWTEFPTGSAMMVNATDKAVGVVFGEKKFLLQPGPSPLLAGVADRDPIPVKIYVDGAGGPRLVAGTHMDFTSDTRRFLLVLPPKRAGGWRLQLVSVDEFEDHSD